MPSDGTTQMDTERLTAKNAKAAKRKTKHKDTKNTKVLVLECGSVLPLCPA